MLAPHIHGGGRKFKRSERRIGSYVVPGQGAPLDRYGNIKGSELVKALSAVKVLDRHQNITKRSARRKTEAFFNQGNVIFKRRGRDITPFLVLTRAPQYTPRLNWQGLGNLAMREDFIPNFERRFAEAVATAKKRGPRR